MTIAEHAKGIAFALEDARLEIADCPDGHMFGSPDVLMALGAISQAIQELVRLDITTDP